jgi:hypothetical protein
MKLFLLNSRENKKPSKIGLIFLGFFYNFYIFLKFLWKRKWKSLNSTGPEAAHTAQPQRETGRAHARVGSLAEGPSGFWLIVNEFSYCFSKSLMICTEVLEVLFLYTDWSPTANRAGAMLRRARLGGARKDWCSQVADTGLNSPRAFPPNQFLDYCPTALCPR